MVVADYAVDIRLARVSAVLFTASGPKTTPTMPIATPTPAWAHESAADLCPLGPSMTIPVMT